MTKPPWGPARWYSRLSVRHPFALLAFYLAVTGAALWQSRKLDLVTDLGALLPRDTTSVRALDESNRRIGSTDMFTIAIESSDVRAIARFQDAAASAIENGDPARGIEPWKDAGWVQVDKPTVFFREHALYYVPRSDLEKLRDRLEDYVQLEASLAGGLSLLEGQEERTERAKARKELLGWFDPDLPDRLGLPPQVGGELRSWFEEASGAGSAASGATGKDAVPEQPSALPGELRDRLIAPDGRTGVVLVRLARPSTDIDYAQMALERGADLIGKLGPGSFSPGLHAEVVGAYRSFMEVEAIGNDAKLATAVSFVLVVGLFVVFFRRLRAVVVITLPLSMGCAWMLALTSLTYGRLTSLTAFVVAMLIGIGDDYGIHLYTRATDEVRAGRSWEDAFAISLSSTGRGLVAGAATTVAALLTLLAAHFKGFFEYGLIASFGVAFCLTTAVLVIPPLVAALERLRPARHAPLPAGSRASSGLIFGRPARRAVLVGLVALLAGGALLAPQLGHVAFEHDFRNLRAPKTKQTIKYGKAIGRDTTTTPNMLLGSSQEQMRAVHAELLRRKHDLADPRIKSFVTIATFVPTPGEQGERRAVMDEIAAILERKAVQKVKDGSTREMLDALETMTSARPFGLDDLPRWVVNMLTESDGKVGRIGYLYAKVEEWDAISVMRYQDDYGIIDLGSGGRVPVAASSFILADVVRTVKLDVEHLALWISLAILVILVLDMRSARGVVAAAAALAVGTVITAEIMGLMDIRLGLYNVIVIPTALALAVDGSIYIVHRYEELGKEGIGELVLGTGKAIFEASLTTAAGFVGLLFIEHRGLRTIGSMAVVAILATMVAALVVTPALLLLFDRILPRKRKAPPAG